jgi:predicted SnoaL-like aldol condensation-catalyzing enzyme
MHPTRKQRVVDLLKSLETKASAPLAFINPDKYIQHNLRVGPGLAGVTALIQNLPPEATVATIRVFEDGDYVFAHTEYNFFGPRIGFDVFRFEDDLIVEHWDNLQQTPTDPSPSGHTMTDGPATASDLDQTEANKALMQRYMDDLLAGRGETFLGYFKGKQYIQHNPGVADTVPGLIAGLQALAASGRAVVYRQIHKYLAKVTSYSSFPKLPSAVYPQASTICTALIALRSPNTGIRSRRSHLVTNGRTAMASFSSILIASRTIAGAPYER